MDFGGTFVKYALIDEDAQLSEEDKSPAPLKSLEEFCSCINHLVSKYRNEISGISISLPGVIDSDSGYVYFSGRYSGIIMQMNLKNLLEDQTGLRVTIENDAKAATLAELWKGALVNTDNAVSIIIGSGVGCGIVMDGQLRRGHNCASGEISPITCRSGQIGMQYSLADTVSMTGFLKRVALAKHMNPLEFEIAGAADETEKKISGKDVFRWIEQEDPAVIDAYDSWLKDLTWLINMIKSAVDPSKVVIGGGVAGNERFMVDLKKYYEQYCDFIRIPGGEACVIERCAFSSEANLVGAAYNWFRQNTENVL